MSLVKGADVHISHNVNDLLHSEDRVDLVFDHLSRFGLIDGRHPAASIQDAWSC